jgi:hypothetical protein
MSGWFHCGPRPRTGPRPLVPSRTRTHHICTAYVRRMYELFAQAYMDGHTVRRQKCPYGVNAQIAVNVCLFVWEKHRPVRKLMAPYCTWQASCIAWCVVHGLWGRAEKTSCPLWLFVALGGCLWPSQALPGLPWPTVLCRFQAKM